VSRSSASRRHDGDGGFSLIEIIISMAIFMIVAVATTPLLVGGLKAGRTAQLNLQGKALGQERLERIRNLPFHVARQNGQYLDVLDIYFRDTVAVGALAAGDTCSQRTYDATSKTYSCTITNLGADYSGFRQVVKIQFLKADRSVVTPVASYTSQTAGVDAPVSNLLGVTVTTSWNLTSAPQSFTVRSLVANAQADPNVISTSLRTSALDITSNLPSGDILQFEGGLLSSEGSLTTGSSASLSAVSARTGLSSGATAVGAALSLTAPPAVTGTSPSDSGGHFLDGSTCAYACFGQTAVSGDQNVTVTSGQPRVSVPSNPVQADLRRTGLNVFRGYSYSNATPAEIAPALGVIGPMVNGGSGGSSDVLRARGYLDATGTGATAVRTSGSVRVDHLELFPTLFAPAGVVQVELDDASLTCQSGGGSASVTASWSGRVRYWSGASNSYVPLTLAPGAAALPLPSSLEVTPGRFLSTWVQSWSALTSTAPVNETSGRRSKGTVSAVLSVLTAETRAGDPTSPLNLAVGSLLCLAEDLR